MQHSHSKDTLHFIKYVWIYVPGSECFTSKAHNILMHSFLKPETCVSGQHIGERARDVQRCSCRCFLYTYEYSVTVFFFSVSKALPDRSWMNQLACLTRRSARLIAIWEVCTPAPLRALLTNVRPTCFCVGSLRCLRVSSQKHNYTLRPRSDRTRFAA